MNKHKILVVDADDDIRGFMVAYFMQFGYEVTTSSDVSGMLNHIVEHDMDLLIIDVGLAGSWELIKILKETEKTSDVAIIMLESMENSRERRPGSSLELPLEWIPMTKPFDVEELKLRIENAIRKNQG